jgi:hypothetical protein
VNSPKKPLNARNAKTEKIEQVTIQPKKGDIVKKEGWFTILKDGKIKQEGYKGNLESSIKIEESSQIKVGPAIKNEDTVSSPNKRKSPSQKSITQFFKKRVGERDANKSI